MEGISQKDIILVDVCEDNFKEYLDIFRVNSEFRKMYESSVELWESIATGTKKDYVIGDTIGCLIYDTNAKEFYGYIEITNCKTKEPSLGISISEEYRNQGIGTVAVDKFVKQIFEKYDYKCIKWEAYTTNLASIQLVKKIGGIKSDNLGGVAKMFAELEEAAGIKSDIETVLYIIDRDRKCS